MSRTVRCVCTIIVASFCGGFKVDKEDIVLEDSNAPKVPPPIISTSAAANSPSLLPSQPLEVLFIERKGGSVLSATLFVRLPAANSAHAVNNFSSSLKSSNRRLPPPSQEQCSPWEEHVFGESSIQLIVIFSNGNS